MSFTVAIFGASGATGTLLTQRCLSAGYLVQVLVRNPGEYSLAHRVQVVRGDVRDNFAVRQTVAGADVVLSALGARSWGKEDVLEDGIPNILAAMKRHSALHGPVRRIIALGSAGALEDSLDLQPAWRRWIVKNIVYKTFLKWPVASQVAQYKLLAASDLDWTMVMPPMLTNGRARGTYRVDGRALPRNGSSISRADVADFMFAQIHSDTWVRKGVYISD
ncbi:MAG: NAD(P)H-binding protein [Acidobacteriota bacterium]|nr:NAD(P)H-binding protein [Acidobacteriota bacterium]